MPTNLSGVVERVNRDCPQLLQTNTHAADGEFLQRVCREPESVAERLGLLSKDESENGYTFPNGKRCSHDVVCFPNGERVDCIQSAGNGMPAGTSWGVIPEYDANGNPQWRPNNVYVDQSSWPLYDSGASGTAPDTSGFKLAYGWFCWMTAWAEWEAESQKNLDWIMAQIGPQVFRVMLCVEGSYHGTPDSWLYARVDPNDPAWSDRFKRMCDQVMAINCQLHCTVYGGRAYTETEDQRRRFHDRIVAAAQGRWAAIRSWEMMNEFKVNKWTAPEVRSAGDDLGSKLPAGYLLSLSSPNLAHGYVNGREPTNEEMGASFDELYKNHQHANECTIHTMRDGGKWSDPFAFNAYYPNLPHINNEPPGPGASAGGEGSTAETIRRDMTNTMNAGWPMYVGHSEWCPWTGHIPQEYWNGWREIKEVWALPNNPECAAVMKELAGEAGEPPKPVAPPGQLLSGMSLLPEESLYSPEKHADLHYQADGNLVSYLEHEPHWSSHTDGESAGRLTMQEDGNLVLTNADGTPIRATRTDGNPGAMVQIQEDGNFCLYANPSGPDAGTPLWASDSSEFYGPDSRLGKSANWWEA